MGKYVENIKITIEITTRILELLKFLGRNIEN